MDGIYNALTSPQHIRILILAPSENVDAALEGSLEQQHIDDATKEYEAISYTWGDQARIQPLRCDGTMINITPNLASALLCFRSRTTPRRLWADAICINQDDLDEKGQQIPLMAKIFRSSTQVRVWLGDGDQGESRALDVLASFARRAWPGRSALDSVESPDHRSGTDQALVDIPRSAKKVFSMPWFGRRWIVQELVLNGDVMFHCGQSKMSWPALHFTFHNLPTDIRDDDLGFHTRRKIRQLGDLWKTWSFGNASTVDRGIYNLLNAFMDLQCKEAKDIVYAIAGLADDIELQSSAIPASVASITPDYGISDEDVFQDLAFKLIQSGKVFSTLAHAGASRIAGGNQTLASWIPDVRLPASWPLIATEQEADFKLLEVCEPSNGSLTLKIEVYGWQLRSSIWELLGPYYRPMLPDIQNTEWKYTGSGQSRLGGRVHLVPESVPDWCPVSVEDVFEASNVSAAQEVRNLLPHLQTWLIDHHGLNKEHSSFDTLAHMVWCLIRCQLLTEDGRESLDRLPSLERFQKKLRNQMMNSKWEIYLAKALFTSKIYIGERVGPDSGNAFRFFGFGPYDLNPGDAILIPSRESTCATALFLRATDSGHRVLGGGLAWAWPDKLFGGIFGPREIEVHLI